MLPADDFISVSSALENATLVSSDFKCIIEGAEKNDFVFADPPYTVAHNRNGFIKYNESLFSWDDQVRLRDCLWQAARRGAMILLTNANHESVRELYKDFPLSVNVQRTSLLSADVRYRNVVEELVVRSWA